MTSAWRWGRASAIGSVSVLLWLASCASGQRTVDPALEGLSIDAIAPEIVVPGSTLVITGESFVDEPWGKATLRLRGSAGEDAIDISLPAAFIDFSRLEIPLTETVWNQLGGAGDFSGQAQIEIESGVTGETYTSQPIFVRLSLRDALSPAIDSLELGEVAFVNDPVVATGSGFLLGPGEGETIARVTGCFTLAGDGTCTPITPVEIPVIPEAGARGRGVFRLAPAITGIDPGRFEGEVVIENRHVTGQVRASEAVALAYELTRPAVFSIAPQAASLGQYVDVSGGGFVGAGEGATVLTLEGTFTPAGGEAVPVSLVLVPEVVSGRFARYVLSEDDSLGEAVDLRATTGTFSGSLTPEVSFGQATVRGDPVAVTLSLLPVKQVVYLRFLPSYVEALRKFGLRAVDRAVRDRVIEVVERDYAGVNLEVRDTEPADFALYSVVDIAGPDPNGLGLLGYDNTPGKDTGNQRLYDRIGGVNATTQEDGFPGYGGVFIESLLIFSASQSGDHAEPAFDDIFDPVRAARGGEPVRAADLAAGVPAIGSGEGCPAKERQTQIACAIWVLGSLIGTTVSHELGHSLGLADPFGNTFHNPGDGPGRLMDAGIARPFAERAELFGQGPGRFCDTEYAYLQMILPADEPADTGPRPSCD